MSALQYHAEFSHAPAAGMNPEGLILRGSDALGNRPLGFIAFDSEVYKELKHDLIANHCLHYNDVDARAQGQSDIIDSYMPDAN